MNWFVGDWLHSRIPAKSSPIPMLSTRGRESATRLWFLRKTHDSARRVSRPGSPSPQHKFRVHSRWASRCRPRGKRVMQRLVDLATAAIAGELGFGQYTGGRASPTRVEIAQLAFTFYDARPAGRPPYRRLAVGRTGTRSALPVTVNRQIHATHRVALIKRKANL